jgi:hypothetical protein
MFFVNGRPCGLPQVAKVFNEVYKSYNLSQSPFILANVILDTSTSDQSRSACIPDAFQMRTMSMSLQTSGPSSFMIKVHYSKRSRYISRTLIGGFSF